MTTDTNGIKRIASNYYKKLLTAETITEDAKCARSEVWNSMQRKVTSEMNSELTLPISDMELRNVVQNMTASCCPGEDGLSIVFFQTYWDIIGDAVREVCNHIIDSGVMPQGMAACLILMIPKGNSQAVDVEKWRPITLLNTIYKIYAKVLSIRIQKFLPMLIHSSQTGFIKERSILDNIFVFWEAVAWAKKSKQNLAILLLDFEKAYDRVDWSFLEGTMEQMGFSTKWIKAVSTMYCNASSKVLIGGGKGSPSGFRDQLDKAARWLHFCFFFLQKQCRLI